MNLWLYSLRDMVRRPGRSLLTFLSIVLGVATVFAVSNTIRGARQAYTRLTETLSGKADAQVLARGGGRFSRELVDPIEKSPAVDIAVPILNQTATLFSGGKKVQINGVGTQIDKAMLLHPFELMSGRLPNPPSEDGDDESERVVEFLLEENLALGLGVTTGDTIKINSWRKVSGVQVVGVIRPTELSAITGGGLAYFNLKDWQFMSKATGKIDALEFHLAPTSDKKQALDSLARLIPENLQLRSSHEEQASGSVTLSAFEYGLEAARTLALVVALLLILNTFFMNVTERRAQIGILRLIGSTRMQVMHQFLRESAILGIAGALVGLPLGWLLAVWLARGMEGAFGMQVHPPELTPLSTMLAFLMGPIVAMAAAYWPARKAGRITPLENVRQRSVARPERDGWKKIIVGVTLLVLSGVGMFLSWARIISQEVALTVAIFFLIGLFLAFPLVLRPGYGLLFRALRFLGPMEFELAHRQLVRSQNRALLTWGILFMAVATSVGTGLILTDVINDIRGEVRSTTRADFVVRVSQIDLANGTSALVPEDLPDEVKKQDGAMTVERMRIFAMDMPAAGRIMMVVREFGIHDRPPMDFVDAKPSEVRQKLLDGEVVISDILAFKTHKKTGDTITIDYAGKEHTFKIAGSSRFYLAGGMGLFLDRSVAEAHFGPVGADALLIDAEPAKKDALEQRLRRLSEDRGLLFQTYADVQERLHNILNTVVASLWVLLALGFLIAVFGVTNTLMMNILEQTREIGLMRVLGMRRRQIRRMVLAQCAYVGILAIIPGFLTGVALAYIIRSSSLAILGESPRFGVLLPWLVPYGFGLLFLVLLFGWLPAARAARLNILDAIRSE